MKSESCVRFEKIIDRLCKVLNKEKRASMKNLKRIQELEKVVFK
jgi:hypothetical protein